MLNAKSFFPHYRPDNQMDVFFAPKKVVEEDGVNAGISGGGGEKKNRDGKERERRRKRSFFD